MFTRQHKNLTHFILIIISIDYYGYSSSTTFTTETIPIEC